MNPLIENFHMAPLRLRAHISWPAVPDSANFVFAEAATTFSRPFPRLRSLRLSRGKHRLALSPPPPPAPHIAIAAAAAAVTCATPNARTLSLTAAASYYQTVDVKYPVLSCILPGN